MIREQDPWASGEVRGMVATMNRIVLGSILATLLAAGCGGKAKPAAAPDHTPPDGMAFKDMNEDQRAAFMKETVLPTMTPIFQAFDPEKFAEVTCKTCHGAGAEDGSFEMPNPDLFVLPGSMEGFQQLAQDPEKAKWMQFMGGQVKPEMAKLLQMSEYDPATNTGDFGCHACHNMAE